MAGATESGVVAPPGETSAIPPRGRQQLMPEQLKRGNPLVQDSDVASPGTLSAHPNIIPLGIGGGVVNAFVVEL